MKRVAAFTVSLWSAAALLYFDARSVAGIALCGVLVLAALDLCAPRADGGARAGNTDRVDRV